jgi:hypothetical protein
MTDDVDAWIDASLENRDRARYKIGGCPNCASTEFHGFARYNCPGSHVVLSKEQLEAIESQGILDWTQIWEGSD